MSENLANGNLNKKAAKAGIWYTIGNILLKGCTFLSLPIFTRILNPNDFGIYNTYIAYEGILTAVLGLGLYGTVKNAKLDYGDKFEEYLSSIVSLSLIFLLLVLIIANITFNIYNDLIGFSRFIVNCLILQSYGSFLIYFYGSKLNIEFKYKSYIGLTCFNTLGNIFISILLILFIFPKQRYLGRIIGSALPLIIIGIFVSIYLLKKGKKIYEKKYWKYALIIGLPLIPHVISQSLLSHFDRIMINNFIGASEAGIYSYIYTICIITYVICTSLDNAWTPWIFLKLKEGKNKEIRETSKKYLLIFTLITIGFVCVIPEITKIIAGKEYWEGISLIVPLTLANYFIFLYMLPVNIEYYHKKTKYISIGTVCAAILNIILNYFAIKRFGYFAAAYTTVISYFALFAFHWLISKRYEIDDIYSIKDFINNILVVSITLMIILFTQEFHLINLTIRYLIVAVILIIIFKNKREIINIMRREKHE